MYGGKSARQRAVYDNAGRLTDWLNADRNAMPLTYFQYTHDPKGLPTRRVREGGKTIYDSYGNADGLTREMCSKSGAYSRPGLYRHQ